VQGLNEAALRFGRDDRDPVCLLWASNRTFLWCSGE